MNSEGMCAHNMLGTGSFARMKGHMNSHILTQRLSMFQQSADRVQDQLNDLIADVGDDLNDKIDEIFLQMRRDYSSVLGGGNIPQDGQMLPKSQRLARKEILRLIEQGEKRLKAAAGFENQDDDMEGKEEKKTDAKVKDEFDDEARVDQTPEADDFRIKDDDYMSE